MNRRVRILVDSGAYSAWKLNTEININNYCDFLEKNQEWINSYVALDIIMPEDTAQAAKKSFENLVYMRKRNLNPIPVYHIGEPIEYLHAMLDLGCDYIGLSATSIIMEKAAIDEWYDLIWAQLVNKDGKPIVKIHAFGEGRLMPLLRYPWFSTDASTWLNAQKYGVIFWRGTKRLGHTRKESAMGSMDDIENLTGENKEGFEEYLAEVGIKLEALTDRRSRSSFIARTIIAAHSFKLFEAFINSKQPITFRPRNPLVISSRYNNAPAVNFDKMSFFMAVGTNYPTIPCLEYADFRNMLVSYHAIRNGKAEIFEKIAKGDDLDFILSQAPFAKTSTLIKEITYARQ